MLQFNPATTALVLIDLQQGILPYAVAPCDGETLVGRAVRLAEAFRARALPVVLVRVGWSSGGGDALRQPVDKPSAVHTLPDNWWRYPAALSPQPQDIQVIKHQWGAFYGTDLDLQLRRRGIDTLVLGGIATNIGVESTARDAWERGYGLLLAEDLCAAADEVQHRHSLRYIFPRIARVIQSDAVLAALAAGEYSEAKSVCPAGEPDPGQRFGALGVGKGV
ncbi:hydrolase [Edwardsiella hoshinae]|uniref:Isochorismatase family protein yecD n=1 Tax=Edwardsiella hoshinae TaxID=93378 RepID=A0A376DGN7_9GAMM|nr:hydrolase [Edwardsiella hoshinae]STC89208.1 Isochorismatase family protein yecD [Edwardsiella hoshinae]